MALVPAILIPTNTLGIAPAASIGGPTSPAHWLIKRLVFANHDSAQHTIAVYRVASGASAVAANNIIDNYTLQIGGMPGATYVAVEFTDMVLNPGDAIYAYADAANAVNYVCSGFTF